MTRLQELIQKYWPQKRPPTDLNPVDFTILVCAAQRAWELAQTNFSLQTELEAEQHTASTIVAGLEKQVNELVAECEELKRARRILENNSDMLVAELDRMRTELTTANQRVEIAESQASLASQEAMRLNTLVNAYLEFCRDVHFQVDAFGIVDADKVNLGINYVTQKPNADAKKFQPDALPKTPKGLAAHRRRLFRKFAKMYNVTIAPERDTKKGGRKRK